jgi:lysylphosphatidylglycerol synthetase-like protein (DUF2156 family)
MVAIQHARRAGTAAWISAALWVVAVSVLATSRGFQDGMSGNVLWILPVLLAVVAFGLAVVGVLRSTGGLRGWWTWLTLAIVTLGLVLAFIGTWAWPLWGLLLSAASLLIVMRRRSSSRDTRRASDWLLVAAWPIGIALAILLSQLHVGPLDEEGDYPVSTGVAFGVGALLFAVSLFQLGRWLRRDKSAGIREQGGSRTDG